MHSALELPNTKYGQVENLQHRSFSGLGASRAGRSPRAVPRERRPQLRGSASPGCVFAVPFAPLGLQCPMCNQEVMSRAGLH